jgi:transposase-like protein
MIIFVGNIINMQLTKCSLPQFRKQFDSDISCLSYLAELKWVNGYKCRHCNHKVSMKGDRNLDKRCQRCGYNESPIAHTVFHSMKIPLVIAFEMVYRICVSKKGISSLALSREYNLNPKTGYNFKRKIQLSMKSSEAHPLEGLVHVDEFVIGGKESGCPGRSGESEKQRVVVAVEIRKSKKKLQMGRAYALTIKNYSSIELKKLFDKHISDKAKIVTDGWTGYKPISESYKIKQTYSEEGRNFPTIHTLIMNIKCWIRGIHHSVSLNHVQHYLDEFCFRLNRRTLVNKMPIFMLNRITTTKYTPVKLTSGGFYG